MKQPPKDPAPPASRPNPLAIAAYWLGARLVEKPSGYFLDRVPVNLTQIMRETNRLLVEAGAEPIGPPHWRAS